MVAVPSPVAPNDFTDAIAADPKQKLNIFQATATFGIMPNDNMTFRLEYGHRKATCLILPGRKERLHRTDGSIPQRVTGDPIFGERKTGIFSREFPFINMVPFTVTIRISSLDYYRASLIMTSLSFIGIIFILGSLTGLIFLLLGLLDLVTWHPGIIYIVLLFLFFIPVLCLLYTLRYDRQLKVDIKYTFDQDHFEVKTAEAGARFSWDVIKKIVVIGPFLFLNWKKGKPAFLPKRAFTREQITFIMDRGNKH